MSKLPKQSDYPQIAAIALQLDQMYNDAVTSMLQHQICIGQKLLEARQYFKGDNEFGKWREACTPIKNAAAAHRMMQVAKQVGNGSIPPAMIENVSWSTAVELSYAPQEVVAAAGELIEQGVTPTTRIVRELKRDHDDSPGDARDVSPEHGTPPPRASVATPGPKEKEDRRSPMDKVIQELLDMDVADRMEAIYLDGALNNMDGLTAAMVAFGTGPLVDYAPDTNIEYAIAELVESELKLKGSSTLSIFKSEVMPTCFRYWADIRKANRTRR